MKLLLDQGVPRRAAALLRDAGVEATHVAEVGLSAADDADILAWCRTKGAVAVTLDTDFHAQIALSGMATPSAIRIRIEGLKGPEVSRLLLSVLETHRSGLEAGALVTIDAKRSRLRRLPITRPNP